MNWTYSLLIALLLQIATAQSEQPNPFTAEIPAIVIDEPFTISWDPTTEGTVTVTLVAVDNNNADIADLVVLGGTLCVPHTHSLTGSIATKANSGRLIANIPNSGSLTSTLNGTPPAISFAIKIVSDSNTSLATYSTVFDIGQKVPESEGDDASTTFSTVTRSTTVEDVTTTSTDPPIPTSSQSHTISSTTESAPIADTTTTGSSLPSESSTPSSTGLSAGAAAGVGVGATLGALILLAIAGFFWWRGRKGSVEPETGASASAWWGWRKKPFGPEPETSASAGALETVESKSKKRVSELDGTGNIPAELEGTPRAELGS